MSQLSARFGLERGGSDNRVHGNGFIGRILEKRPVLICYLDVSNWASTIRAWSSLHTGLDQAWFQTRVAGLRRERYLTTLGKVKALTFLHLDPRRMRIGSRRGAPWTRYHFGTLENWLAIFVRSKIPYGMIVGRRHFEMLDPCGFARLLNPAVTDRGTVRRWRNLATIP